MLKLQLSITLIITVLPCCALCNVNTNELQPLFTLFFTIYLGQEIKDLFNVTFLVRMGSTKMFYITFEKNIVGYFRL